MLASTRGGFAQKHISTGSVWSAGQSFDVARLFDEDMLGEDLESWIAESSMLRRSFRTVAAIAGLIEGDVLRKHQPDHVLLRATPADAASGLIDLGRVGGMLRRVKSRIAHMVLSRVFPLARISHRIRCIGAPKSAKIIVPTKFFVERRISPMQTECSAELFAFAPVEGRAVVAGFDGGTLTSDAGALLLGATDQVIGLTRRFAACFQDARNPAFVEHDVATLVSQRIIGIALGYEDLIDHDQLRHDPVLAVLAGKLEARRSDCAPLAGKSTLNRLELGQPEPSRYAKISADTASIERLFVDMFLDAHAEPPKQIILDLDATDDPLHGHQEGRFFHGYYDCYCYLPLYVFCGRHLLAAKLRQSDIDGSAGAVEEVSRIVAQIRARWPKTRILLRATLVSPAKN